MSVHSRVVRISVVDQQGVPAGGAKVAVRLDGKFAGTLRTGTGSREPLTLEVRGRHVAIDRPGGHAARHHPIARA